MSQAIMTNRLARDLDNILARTEPLWQELRGQRILITGATGFFGCWLLESFAWANRRLNLNAHAVGLVAASRNAGEESAPPGQRSSDHTSRRRCSLRRRFPKAQFSHVIHAATEASATLNSEAPLVMFDTIVEGTRRALQFSIAQFGQSDFCSSVRAQCMELSRRELTHVTESFTGGPDPLDPANAYAEGKRAAEMLCALAASPAWRYTIARCFAFVGPYMKLDAHFAIGNFIADAMRGGPIVIKGDGSPVRSYLYASDLVVWLWTILFKGQSCRAYNVGSEDALNIAAVANEVAAAPGSQLESGWRRLRDRVRPSIATYPRPRGRVRN